MISKLRFCCTTDDGFSLIEVAIALTVMGIVAGIALPTFIHMQHLGKIKTTRLHQETVLMALSHYALNNGELPLPATASNHGIAADSSLSQQLSHNSGYVPYATLGISYQYALDGFQQPIIYTVAAMTDIDKELKQGYVNPTDPSAQANTLLGPETFCHKRLNKDLAFDIVNQHQSPVFNQQSDDFVAVVLLSRGEEASSQNPSATEYINVLGGPKFYDHPYTARQDSPHRHHLKWVTRDFLAGHYGQVSCPSVRLNFERMHTNRFNPSNDFNHPPGHDPYAAHKKTYSESSEHNDSDENMHYDPPQFPNSAFYQ